MANLCSYKVKVKGPRNACYAFFGSMSCADDKSIVSEEGTAAETILIFEGNCKWSVDSYCKQWKGNFPVLLPENAENAMYEAEKKYWYHTVQERSKMFNVEVWCNSGDLDDVGYIEEMLADIDDIEDVLQSQGIDVEDLDLSIFCYEHYINGESCYDDCPDEIKFDLNEDADADEDEDLDPRPLGMGWDEAFDD